VIINALEELLQDAEEGQVQIDGEWGDCRGAAQLYKDGAMPTSFYNAQMVIDGLRRGIT
jgi:hypothetical protein